MQIYCFDPKSSRLLLQGFCCTNGESVRSKPVENRTHNGGEYTRKEFFEYGKEIGESQDPTEWSI